MFPVRGVAGGLRASEALAALALGWCKVAVEARKVPLAKPVRMP